MLLLLLVNIWFWAKNDQIWLPEARWMIFSNIWTDFNFIFGQFYVARKLILNGGAIRPTGLLLMYLVSYGFSSSQPHPPQSSSSTKYSQEWMVSVQKGGCKTFNKSITKKHPDRCRLITGLTYYWMATNIKPIHVHRSDDELTTLF